jgi:exodeoxyribonuclease-3
MKIITWNINGYRSADKSGSMDELISKSKPDIICLQEIKMNNEIINNYDYNCYYNFALKKGYSGTMIFSKEKPINIINKIGLERFDEEGRFLLLEYNNFIIINLYIPHGGRQKENHPYKFMAINKVLNVIKKLNKKVIICTDFNIAHQELDVARYKYNYDNNMFTSKERGMIDELLKIGFLDSFRVKVKEGNIYSMWPNGFNARERNLGWRIDYIFISEKFKESIKQVKYLKDQYGSDHCPYILELDNDDK